MKGLTRMEILARLGTEPNDIYLWWPIRFAWVRNSTHKFFAWHGWEVSSMVFGIRRFGQTFHAGAFKVIVGPK